MDQEFTKLYHLPKNLYLPGAPVLIAAGALLRYNYTGQVLLQLKFRNLVTQRISAMRVTVTSCDQNGQALGDVWDFQYLNLSSVSCRNAEFGDQQANFLPNPVVAAVQIRCISVSFADGTVWQQSADTRWTPLPEQTYLRKELGNLAYQYQQLLGVNFKHGPYMPLEYENLWLCACGGVNHTNDAYCFSCGCEKRRLFAALDKNTLIAHKEAFEAVAARRSAENAERQRRAREEKAQKTKTIGYVAILAVSLLVIIVLIAQLAH